MSRCAGVPPVGPTGECGRRGFRRLVAPLVLAAWLVGLAGVGPIRADDAALPVTVPVRSRETYLRAGPGDDFYPTERLAAGATVEVWAIDPSGYCAVRPVEGSFSWVRE